MAEKLLQINFKFNVSKAEYEQAAASLAPSFAEVDGLRWKVWILNEAEGGRSTSWILPKNGGFGARKWPKSLGGGQKFGDFSLDKYRKLAIFWPDYGTDSTFCVLNRYIKRLAFF